MPLTNEQQAGILALSVFLLALGTASAAIPDFMPAEIRIPLAILLWFCSIIGFALKEAMGGTPKQSEQTQLEFGTIEQRLHQIQMDSKSLRDQVTELAKTHPQTAPPPTPTQNPSEPDDPTDKDT